MTGLPNIDAVIFDLDGVVIDSEGVWADVRREFTENHAGHWEPDAQRTNDGHERAGTKAGIQHLLDDVAQMRCIR